MVKPTPYGWLAIAGLAGAGALLWAAHATDRSSVAWTDPEQPPAMTPLPIGQCGARIQRPWARTKAYPDSLAAWGDSVVGDC